MILSIVMKVKGITLDFGAVGTNLMTTVPDSFFFFKLHVNLGTPVQKYIRECVFKSRDPYLVPCTIIQL